MSNAFRKWFCGHVQLIPLLNRITNSNTHCGRIQPLNFHKWQVPMFFHSLQKINGLRPFHACISKNEGDVVVLVFWVGHKVVGHHCGTAAP